MHSIFDPYVIYLLQFKLGWSANIMAYSGETPLDVPANIAWDIITSTGGAMPQLPGVQIEHFPPDEPLHAGTEVEVYTEQTSRLWVAELTEVNASRYRLQGKILKGSCCLGGRFRIDIEEGTTEQSSRLAFSASIRGGLLVRAASLVLPIDASDKINTGMGLIRQTVEDHAKITPQA